MKTIEKNALRITELMNPLTKGNCPNLHKLNLFGISKRYRTYEGLMPIVFECNSGDSAIKLKKHFVEFWYLGDNETSHYNDYRSNYIITKPEFIEAIQLACIKYLELKDE